MQIGTSGPLGQGLPYCKVNRLILLTLGSVIGPTIGTNRLTFGGDLVPDTDSG